MSVNVKEIFQIGKHKTECLIIHEFNGSKLTKQAMVLEQAWHKTLSHLLKRGDISGAVSQAVLVPAVKDITAKRVLFLASGEGKKISRADFKTIANTLFNQLSKAALKNATLVVDVLSIANEGSHWLIEQLAKKITIRNYQYNTTHSKKQEITAHQLGNLSPNVCTPYHIANQAKALARKNKALRTTIIEEKAMREPGMGSLLSVTAGSVEPAKLIVMEYQGASKKDQPRALVGKGITFDTKDVSLKPGDKMNEMKFDRCGAVSVMGAMTILAELTLPINVVATKLSDVVTSMSGETIEILNTDAEGRLVRCDALIYVAALNHNQCRYRRLNMSQL